MPYHQTPRLVLHIDVVIGLLGHRTTVKFLPDLNIDISSSMLPVIRISHRANGLKMPMNTKHVPHVDTSYLSLACTTPSYPKDLTHQYQYISSSLTRYPLCKSVSVSPHTKLPKPYAQQRQLVSLDKKEHKTKPYSIHAMHQLKCVL
jgi:hypothetical protein